MNIDCIDTILNSGFKASLAVTGGGSGAVHALLSTPGASSFVVDVRIPYSPEALEEFLGEKPERSCSPETAKKLATKNVEALRADMHSESALDIMGIGCTAALQTERERRGADRAFICIKTLEAEKLYALCFSNVPRAVQEALLSDWLLVLIAQAVGAARGLMLPGSFNPVHKGHFGMLKAAGEITGLRGFFELSATNVDKPDIPPDEILRRISAVRDIPVALTRAPRFTQKAGLFPNTTFVLGYDTAARLTDPSYCLETPREGTRPTEEKYRPDAPVGCRPEMWREFEALGTRFLVAGRTCRPGDPTRREKFMTLRDLKRPSGFESLFDSIPEVEFREDISSTELRNQ